MDPCRRAFGSRDGMELAVETAGAEVQVDRPDGDAVGSRYFYGVPTQMIFEAD